MCLLDFVKRKKEAGMGVPGTGGGEDMAWSLSMKAWEMSFNGVRERAMAELPDASVARTVSILKARDGSLEDDPADSENSCDMTQM